MNPIVTVLNYNLDITVPYSSVLHYIYIVKHFLKKNCKIIKLYGSLGDQGGAKSP